MAWALFLVVAGIWAVFLLPPLWADRRRSSIPATRRQPVVAPPSSTGAAPSTYQSPSHPEGGRVEEPDPAVILVRRRRALMILAVAVLTSLVALVVFGGTWLVAAHGFADALLVWYLVALRRIAKARQESAPVTSGLEDEMMEMSRVRVVRSR